ncbi:MAG: hypothetical protein U0931_39425 [Vulcanimicrobiota bacterium]
MDLRVALVGFLLLGCSPATPVPDWTPPRAEARPSQPADPQLAETESQSLPVKAPPKPVGRQSLIVGQAPVSLVQQPVVPRSEPSPDYPRYQGHQPGPLPVALSQAPAPQRR